MSDKQQTPQRRTELSKLLDDFLAYLEITKNRSPLTIANYRFYLERFFSMMKLERAVDVTNETIKRYRLILNRFVDGHGEGLAKATQNYHLIAIRAFLKYLAKEDIMALAPEKVELMKLPERQVEFLDGSDLEALLAQPMKTKNLAIVQKRDKAILETLFSTGMRVSELVGLQRQQIAGNKEELSIRGKGSKLRMVFLSNQARYWIKEYLALRMDNTPFVFLRHDRAGNEDVAEEGKSLTPRSVERLISRYAVLAGIRKKVTPHTLRHSYATDMLANGADLRSVQALLGHSSITTTQVYTHVTDQHLHDVHRAFHARRRKKE